MSLFLIAKCGTIPTNCTNTPATHQQGFFFFFWKNQTSQQITKAFPSGSSLLNGRKDFSKVQYHLLNGLNGIANGDSQLTS